jgi:tetratricopeptide (TPR) repeat protein
MKLSDSTMRWVETTVIIALVLFFSIATFQRNFIWKDDISLWSDVVKKSPGKPRAYVGLARALKKAGRFEEALAMQEKALAINPGYAVGRVNLATAIYRQGVMTRPSLIC